MHIGTGIYEGKEIKDPKEGTLSARALTIKEEVFTIIGIRISEAVVLDVNDQSGMFGIESLTRGAKCCCFFNYNEAESDLIRENLKIIGVEEGNKVNTGDIKDLFEKKIVCGCEKYKVIFFEIRNQDEMALITPALEKQDLDGITILIYPNKTEFDLAESYDGSEIVETRDFDDKRIAVFLKKK